MAEVMEVNLTVDVSPFLASLRLLTGSLRVALAGENLRRQHDLAVELGVTDKRIATWRSRSARNGFPAPIASNIGPTLRGGKRRHSLWDIREVEAWFRDYSERQGRSTSDDRLDVQLDVQNEEEL